MISEIKNILKNSSSKNPFKNWVKVPTIVITPTDEIAAPNIINRYKIMRGKTSCFFVRTERGLINLFDQKNSKNIIPAI